MSKDYPRVAVVLLNWNGADDTIDCLESLVQTTYPDLTVIVLDNASTDDSVEQLESWMQTHELNSRTVSHPELSMQPSQPAAVSMSRDLLLITSKVNHGFCKGNNIGMEQGILVGADYLLILNNDTRVAPDFLEPMVEVAESDASVGLVGGIITYCDEPDRIWWAGGKFNRFLDNERLLDRKPLEKLQHREPFETEWVSGCMMLIPSRIFKKLGGYVEEYFIWSEEWDYSLLVSSSGYRLMVAPQSRICHKVGRSLGIMKPLNYYYGIRNGLIFKRKYLSTYIWYPYLLQYLANRVVRYTQFALQGRFDLVHAGAYAIWDYLRGKSGEWDYQQKSYAPDLPKTANHPRSLS